MVDKRSDPIALWQQMIGDMQKGFSAFAKQGLGSSLSGKSTDQDPVPPSGARKQMTDLMENYFIGMNLPSRTQLNGMGERLQAIEVELSEIKALLHQILTSSQSKDAAPQLQPLVQAEPEPRPPVQLEPEPQPQAQPEPQPEARVQPESQPQAQAPQIQSRSQPRSKRRPGASPAPQPPPGEKGQV